MVIQGHNSLIPRLSQNHSSIFVYQPILMKICMNVNKIKTHFFHWIIIHLKCHFYVVDQFWWIFFTLRPSDLIRTLTCVLINNFCPCLRFWITFFYTFCNDFWPFSSSFFLWKKKKTKKTLLYKKWRIVIYPKLLSETPINDRFD